jgi:biopolymer transport protein ExbD
MVHSCSDEVAFRELGDDRQIIVANYADGSISINETPFTSATVGPELAKIFESRRLKLVWFIGDPQLTYGQAIKNLSDLHADSSAFVIALPTTSQIAAANSLPHVVSQCPYGF